MSTNENIKNVALKLFASNGYHGTSLEDISKIVGIRKSSIYSHFISKEDLYFTILDDVLLWNIISFKNLINGFCNNNIEENLYSIFKYYYLLYFDESNNKILFINRAILFPPEDIKEKIQQKFRDHEKNFNEILIDIFNQGIKDKVIKNMDIKDLLAFFYCMVDGLFIESHYYARHKCSLRFNSIWNLFWQAIKI